MCMGCVVEEEVLFEVVPGFKLSRATNDTMQDEWPKGHLALFEVNGPTFILGPDPFLSPYDGMTDEEIENSPSDMDDEFMKWDAAAEAFTESMLKSAADIDSFARLTMACMRAGYAPRIMEPSKISSAVDGDLIPLDVWLFERIARMLKEKANDHKPTAS